jgi:hypothetical protein
MFVNNVYRQGDIPAGRVYTITERRDVDPNLGPHWGTYVYSATATVNGEKHDTEFRSTFFDDGSVIVSMRRKLKAQARDLASGEVAGILRHRDKTAGLAPEGSALDRALAMGELPGLVGQFLTDEPTISKGNAEEGVKMALRKIGEKVRGRRGGRRTRRRRSQKTRRSRK